MRRGVLLLAALLLLGGCAGRPAAPTGQPEAASPGPRREAPALTVSCGEAQVTPIGGAVRWEWDNGDGTRTMLQADMIHPLSLWGSGGVPELMADGAQPVTFLFEVPPDGVKLRYWTTDGGDSANIRPVTDAAAKLVAGRCLYVVTASWDRMEEEGWKGSAQYIFSADTGSKTKSGG